MKDVIFTKDGLAMWIEKPEMRTVQSPPDPFFQIHMALAARAQQLWDQFEDELVVTVVDELIVLSTPEWVVIMAADESEGEGSTLPFLD